eukprot:1252812-Pyramimonas_sp.AAC.1
MFVSPRLAGGSAALVTARDAIELLRALARLPGTDATSKNHAGPSRPSHALKLPTTGNLHPRVVTTE